jgi:hypothetical protein
MPNIKKIPYGISDFEAIQTENYYFVDKTRFIYMLENHKYIFFIRPRRFGKSLWLSILESYYDISAKDIFHTLFKDTEIGKNPTKEKNSYLILRFDFSLVDLDKDRAYESFEKYGNMTIHFFMKKYAKYFSNADLSGVEKAPALADKLNYLFSCAVQKKLKIYILIDEYDNFANTILSIAGSHAYHNLTHGEGFFRHFFAVLKGATAGSGGSLARLFITGVSPITMDDVTSGFNIGTNLTLFPSFNEMAGFTRLEVLKMLDYYKKAGLFKLDTEECIEIMHNWYDGYIFSEEESSSIFNSDMVLYFFKIIIKAEEV